VRPDGIQGHLGSIASANWHASASFLAASFGDGLFVDIGSTTSDLITLHQGRPASRGYTDAERLQSEEMVYTGVVRTPVMAVARHLPFAGEWQRLAAEHFATMADVYRLSGELPEEYDMSDTADGAGKTEEDSARRLARMVGRDMSDAPMHQWRLLARAARSRQVYALQTAIERHLSRGLLAVDAPLIGAGAGRFLVRELAQTLHRPYVDAENCISGEDDVAAWAGTCLPAYAVALLSSRSEAWP
jgi:(4-(4-[2-(gamma-L-glutamylamino)ethyl]phenoxymethyl)furan-2-yl)methanamine synthase